MIYNFVSRHISVYRFVALGSTLFLDSYTLHLNLDHSQMARLRLDFFYVEMLDHVIL